MLYPTLNQPLIVLIIFTVGMASGLIFDIARILTTISGEKWSKHIFDFLATIICFFALFFINLSINLGQFRIYILAVYLASFTLERFFSKILWTKLLLKWYTNVMNRRKKKVEKGKVD